MKYFSLALAAVVMATALSACQPTQNASSSSQSTPPPQSSSVASSDAAPSSSSVSSLPSQAPSSSSEAPKGSALAGTYRPTESQNGLALSLVLEENGNFALTAKVLILSGSISGTYSLEGDTLTLEAAKADLPGFSGENLGQFKMTLKEDGSLYYRCDDFLKQAGIQAESFTFVKEKAKS